MRVAYRFTRVMDNDALGCKVVRQSQQRRADDALQSVLLKRIS